MARQKAGVVTLTSQVDECVELAIAEKVDEAGSPSSTKLVIAPADVARALQHKKLLNVRAEYISSGLARAVNNGKLRRGGYGQYEILLVKDSAFSPESTPSNETVRAKAPVSLPQSDPHREFVPAEEPPASPQVAPVNIPFRHLIHDALSTDKMDGDRSQVRIYLNGTSIGSSSTLPSQLRCFCESHKESSMPVLRVLVLAPWQAEDIYLLGVKGRLPLHAARQTNRYRESFHRQLELAFENCVRLSQNLRLLQARYPRLVEFAWHRGRPANPQISVIGGAKEFAAEKLGYGMANEGAATQVWRDLDPMQKAAERFEHLWANAIPLTPGTTAASIAAKYPLKPIGSVVSLLCLDYGPGEDVPLMSVLSQAACFMLSDRIEEDQSEALLMLDCEVDDRNGVSLNQSWA